MFLHGPWTKEGKRDTTGTAGEVSRAPRMDRSVAPTPISRLGELCAGYQAKPSLGEYTLEGLLSKQFRKETIKGTYAHTEWHGGNAIKD